ncbi:single-stranded nucleic acid binding R3H domain-containing protein [Gloeomargarita lithophora Alchichica-D10]|uniref:Single-stranded nucleic acid binding R3H domain-containing protein n=1 Tax=Gloeomargarita lithophora Alchichica-D10 TaxID=1188229 RepID=A0A1J0A8W7_9CYAN|nr:R3H domain-containing nucleic acid-binding protein [Gloeomargarita lithophora]APB32384.1 single-stranded nucleic acid binding R3H domain-containing protein [Gloeomargarita lithophora Alchichica-D10]
MTTEQLTRGQVWLQDVLQLTGMAVPVTIDPQRQWLVIETQDPQQVNALLGSQGMVLDALQYLANVNLNLHLPPEEQFPFTLELAGYRAQRQQELEALVTRAAEQVRHTGQEVAIPQLSAAERRQVHTLFQQYDDLETVSRGQEPERYLVVLPKTDTLS